MELDPTLNENLHIYIWKELLKRIHYEVNHKNNNSPKIITKLNNVETKLSRLSSKETQNVTTSIESHNISPEKQHGKNMRRLLKLVTRAFINPIEIPWDAEDYYWQHVKGGRDKRRIKFPDPTLGEFSEPLTLVDSNGRIVLWYLPGLLSEEQLISVKAATIDIEPLLKKSTQTQLSNKSTPSWRTVDGNFIHSTATDAIEPGAVTFSAGWFAQGHETDEYKLLPSLNLRSHHPKAISNWLGNSNQVERFLNLTLSLIHPDLYRMGMEMLQELRTMEDTMDISKKWQSVYTGISVICNRITPLHRDLKGRPEWFDILINYSETGSSPEFVIGDLGLKLKYTSGTVIGFCGNIFQHGVKYWGTGNRICYANFMRETVRARLDVSPAGWVHRSKYLTTQPDIGDDMVVD